VEGIALNSAGWANNILTLVFMMHKKTYSHMKKFLLPAALFALAACGDASKSAGEAGDVAAGTGTSYAIDAAASSLTWEGAKMSETVHSGTIKLSEGTLSVKDGRIEAGSFTIDMNSITDTDLTDTTYANKLVGHLKSADFFQTDSFPTARFEITGVTPSASPDSVVIAGNLTLKGVTNGISFPARVAVADSTVDASARITINRNDWGVTWGGSKTDKSIMDMLKNNLIKDEITLIVSLKAKK
jgi:polyisoprenoid-binding protein YceI